MPVDGRRVDHELVRVGAPVGAHRGGLAPHEPAAAAPRSAPSGGARGRWARPAVVPSQPSIGSTAKRFGAVSVPALASVNGHRRRERPGGSTASATGISRPSSSTRGSQRSDGAEPLDLGIRVGHGHALGGPRARRGRRAVRRASRARRGRRRVGAARRAASRRSSAQPAQLEPHRGVVAVRGDRLAERERAEVLQHVVQLVEGAGRRRAHNAVAARRTPRARTSRARAGSRSRTSPCRWRGRCR